MVWDIKEGRILWKSTEKSTHTYLWLPTTQIMKTILEIIMVHKFVTQLKCHFDHLLIFFKIKKSENQKIVLFSGT